MDKINSETMSQLQDEIFGMLEAWRDRGIGAEESVIILTGTAHSTLAGLGYSLGQIVTLLVNGWQKNDGKL